MWRRPPCSEGVHRFEPRYDTTWPPNFVPSKITGYAPEMIEGMKNKVYVQDVCVRCGTIRKRA